MSKPKRLSGDEIIKILTDFGFSVHSQRGSHVKLRRINPSGEKETLTIPRHREIDSGTVHAIFRQATKYIPANELKTYLFTE